MTSSLSSASSSKSKNTATKFLSPTAKRLSRIIFWMVFLTAITLSIQAIFPGIAYFREIAIAEFGEGTQASLWVWFTFFIRNINRIIFLAIGTLIYLQKPDERISFISSIFLLAYGSGSTLYAQYVPDVYAYSLEHLLLLQFPLSYTGWFILYIYFIYFPDGRPVPRIAQFQILPIFVVDTAFYVPQDSPYYAFNWHPALLAIVIAIALGVPLLAQIYRYRNVSTAVQRQQTKIVLSGFALGILNIIVAIYLFGANLDNPVTFINMSTMGDGGFVIIPIALAIAMLRYRLWELDSIINQLSGYLIVGTIAFGLFLAFLFGLQATLNTFQPLIALLLSMTVIGFSFHHLHGSIQRWVDRHIYNLRFSMDELRMAHRRREISNPGALSGQQLGQYQILDVVGKGGMGEVYKATDGTNLRAIKTLLTEKTITPELVERFKREGEIGQRLNHPNIARVYEIDESNGTLYMVMDYMEGQDLGALLKAESKLDPQTVREIIRDLAAALDTAHADGMVHRDIKPGNVMMQMNDDNETYRAVLMDFGVTKLKDANTLTGTGAIGTIDYMAPEQILEARNVDHRADIYALGILAYRMLTGELPFSGGPGQVMFAHIQKPAPDPRDIDEDLPRPMAKAIMRALEKDPEARFESAGAFAEAFSQ